MKKQIATGLLVLIIIAIPLWADDIVFDPAVYGQALLEVSQLIQSYEEIKALYELEVSNLKMVPVNMITRYRTLGASWYGLQLPFDRFGNLGPWLQAANAGGSALGPYNGASVILQPYGSVFSQLAPAFGNCIRPTSAVCFGPPLSC
jgi:hypothetical protein